MTVDGLDVIVDAETGEVIETMQPAAGIGLLAALGLAAAAAAAAIWFLRRR